MDLPSPANPTHESSVGSFSATSPRSLPIPPPMRPRVLCLQACAQIGEDAIHDGQMIPALLVKLGITMDDYAENTQLLMYCKCGNVESGQSLFDMNAREKYALAWNVEDLMPPSEKYVFNFNSKEELKRWHLYSDSEYGGLSSASLEITDAGSGAGLSGIFSGNLSVDVAEGSTWRMNRSGFCGMRSKKFDGFIDLDAYDTIAMRLRGDGRCYISTIPLHRYLPTWRGNIISAKLEMNPSRILGMSLSVNAEGGVPGAKSGPGDFRVEIDWIKALRT
ncbi:putative complex I intermediate-associated protein 30 [Cocos nucifera]|uniref:Putative complex I intermediate-associated protein 30 n=1 Tax=Cocos nucifera TaxID=13894 RepID=A0A8K0I7S7_COCNU|nr:putative complex I intermediate-associated protein 30 [Cocos nucifera]